MKVPHLNEFLKRAMKANILNDLSIDFSRSDRGFCNRQIVTVSSRKDSRDGVTLVSGDERWSWGFGGSSLEIVSIRYLRWSTSGLKIHIYLGRDCNSRGELR